MQQGCGFACGGPVVPHLPYILSSIAGLLSCRDGCYGRPLPWRKHSSPQVPPSSSRHHRIAQRPRARSRSEGAGVRCLFGFRGLWGIFWSRACRENVCFKIQAHASARRLNSESKTSFHDRRGLARLELFFLPRGSWNCSAHWSLQLVCEETALFGSLLGDRAGSGALPCGGPKEESKHLHCLLCFDLLYPTTPSLPNLLELPVDFVPHMIWALALDHRDPRESCCKPHEPRIRLAHSS